MPIHRIAVPETRKVFPRAEGLAVAGSKTGCADEDAPVQQLLSSRRVDVPRAQRSASTRLPRILMLRASLVCHGFAQPSDSLSVKGPSPTTILTSISSSAKSLLLWSHHRSYSNSVSLLLQRRVSGFGRSAFFSSIADGEQQTTAKPLHRADKCPYSAGGSSELSRSRLQF